MQRRLVRIRLITTGSTFAAFAVASLIGGFIVLDRDPPVGTALIILGGIFLLVSALFFVGLVLIGRMAPRALDSDQQRSLATFLRVNRYVRGAVEAVAGVGLMAAGIGMLVGGTTFGVVILIFGSVLCLLAATNVWLARRLVSTPRADSTTET